MTTVVDTQTGTGSSETIWPEGEPAYPYPSVAAGRAAAFEATVLLGTPGVVHWPRWEGLDRLSQRCGIDTGPLSEALAYFPEHEVLMHMVNEPEVTPRALRVLADYPDAQLLYQVAAHANVPEDVLAGLSEHMHPRVRESVAGSPRPVPEHVQKTLLVDASAEVRMRLAQRPDITVEVINGLAEDHDDLVVERAITNERLPLETARTLLRRATAADSLPGWLATLMFHGPRYADETFISEIADLAGSHFPEGWVAILESENTPVELLQAAARRRSRLTAAAAAALAENRRTPTESLSRLLRDRRVSVQVSLAGNPNAAPEDVGALAECQRNDVAKVALANPTCPPQLLHVNLSGIRRVGAAANPNIDPAVLIQWSRQAVQPSRASSWQRARYDLEWIGVALRNPSLPREAWEILTFSEQRNITLAALRAEACPPDLLSRQAMHSDRLVRRTAAENPNCPEEGKAAAALLG